MNVTFGLALDGYESAAPPHRLNETCCGPLGLLELLETRLGLKGKRVSLPQRTAQYCALLEAEAAVRPAFYRASFEKDPYAVAEALLGWRDDLIAAGWDGSADASDSPRLQDLAAIEVHARTALASGWADRLRAVLGELDRRSPRIDSVTVLEDREHLPRLWQRVCDSLSAVYAPVHTAPAVPPAEAHSDLGKVQQVIARGGAAKVVLTGDRSVLCLTAQSEITLARAAAQWLQRFRQSAATPVTLIAGDGAGVLEQALADLDEPVTGLPLHSAARPIPQVLLLALRLYWKPLDPRALLEFLTHPVCPVSGFLRGRLAQVVAASPGVGGPEWAQAIDAARESVRKTYPGDEQRERLQRLDDDLDRWLLVSKFDPAEGAPGAVLSECSARVARWAAGRAEGKSVAASDLEPFWTLASLASELAALLQPLPRVKRSTLERMLRQVTASGWPARFAEPELGHVHRVHSPAALIEPAEAIVWWNFIEPQGSPRAPWTSEERRQLETHGARLLLPEVEAARETASWLRPLWAARRQLLLLTPRQRHGEATARHPLQARLLASIGDPALPTLDLDRALAAGQAPSPLALAPLPRRPLPPLRRWWRLTSGAKLGPRDEESYSSAEKFIFSPYAWVLRYKARLQPGPLSSARLQDDHRQKGTLLHRLLDRLLETPASVIDWRTTDQARLATWAETQWPPLLEQEGANLLLPGKRADAAALLETGKAALWQLLEQLRAAHVVEARSNLSLTPAAFVGGRLGGTLDLWVKNAPGRTAVVDLKFGGRDVREKELADNRPLQLAVYAYLLRPTLEGAWPATAFYILSRQRLIAESDAYFPHTRTVRPVSSPGGIDRCWADFEEVWRWRRAQLDAGWIEVTLPGAPPTLDTEAPDSQPPRPQWLATEAHARYNDYDALTGWEGGA